MVNPTARNIRISAGAVELEGELNGTRAALAIWGALPIDARCSTWGDEIYFSIPVEEDLEDGQEVVEVGDLGYWPPGSALCIFFGPTPASRAGEIRPASAVTVIGKVLGDATVLKQVRTGTPIRIEPDTRTSAAGDPK